MFPSKCNQEVADDVPLVDGRVSEPCGFKRDTYQGHAVLTRNNEREREGTYSFESHGH
jgi:hypothetical protein